MKATVGSKIRRLPNWVVRKCAGYVASIPRVSDESCPTFPALSPEYLKNHGYFSQNGQDYLVDQLLLGELENGVFVDVGAHDGCDLSNTFFFESRRSWSGLCVEANPQIYKKLIINRNCITEHIAVGAGRGLVDFTVIQGPDMLSGVNANFGRKHRRRINREIRQTRGSRCVIQVPLTSLQSLLDVHGMTQVDFLTIDTEGSEMEVLKGIDFKRTRISLIIIERNYKSGRIPRFLKNKGFTRLMALAWDDIYVRDDLLLKLSNVDN